MSDEDRLRAFVEQIARLEMSCEHTPADPEDATLTLDWLIQKARELTGGTE